VASIDVSDGFLRDLGHLCEAGGCGAEVELTALPIARGATKAHALGGGEDYALLFVARPGDAPALLSALDRSRTPACVVGQFTRRTGIRLFEKGQPVPLPKHRGWDHLA
jgi:thiamine-monophosphate kinase